MFSRRRRLDRRRMYTREFLESFADQLKSAGFEKISVVLPHNYASVDPRQSEEPLETFFERERNFAAVIFKAQSTARNETLKVLFINSNARAIFADDTFPMAESEPSGVHFQSPDPGRTVAVFEYFFDYLAGPPIGQFVADTLLALASILVITLEITIFVGRQSGLLHVLYSLSPLWDILIVLLAAYKVYQFTAKPTGLWVKPRRELKMIYLLNMALKGELRDNPIVNLIISIVGGLIVAGVAKWLGWI